MGQQGAVRTRTAKDRESWTVVEGPSCSERTQPETEQTTTAVFALTA